MTKAIVFSFSLTLLSACATSRAVLNPNWQPESKPSYVDYLDAYALGFVGGGTRVDVSAVCMDQRPYAIQQGTTVQDGLLTLVTLGVYAPTTIKVWCGR